MHAIRMFVILCLHFYEIGPSPGKNTVPPVDPTNFISIARPQEDRLIVLRRRQGTWAFAGLLRSEHSTLIKQFNSMYNLDRDLT